MTNKYRSPIGCDLHRYTAYCPMSQGVQRYTYSSSFKHDTPIEVLLTSGSPPIVLEDPGDSPACPVRVNDRITEVFTKYDNALKRNKNILLKGDKKFYYYMKSLKESEPHRIIQLATDRKRKDGGISKAFGGFDSLDETIEWLSLRKEVPSHYYEVIQEGRVYRPYLDLDMNDTSDDEALKALSDIIDGFIHVLDSQFDIELTAEDFLVCRSIYSTGGKNSFHVIVPYCFFSDIKVLRKCIDVLKEAVEPECKKYIDTSVYANNKQLRLLGSNKLGKPYNEGVKELLGSWKYHGDPIESKIPETFEESLRKTFICGDPTDDDKILEHVNDAESREDSTNNDSEPPIQ